MNGFNSKSEEWACKGAFFRCRVNRYIQGEKIRSDISFTLLKRRSCTGIPKDGVSTACCHHALEHHYENVGADIFGDGLELPENAVHGAVYELKCRPPSRGYGGVPYEDDDFRWYLEEVKEGAQE